MVDILQDLRRAVKDLDYPGLRVVQSIFKARTPLLKLAFKEQADEEQADARGSTRLAVDLSVGGSLERAACDRCAYSLLASDHTRRAAALCGMIKVWAKHRGLTDTRGGGLSSFCFVLLGVFFLQGRWPSGPRLRPYTEVGTLDALLAGKEDECPRQLLVSGEGLAGSVELLAGFFAWACDLPKRATSELCVLSGKLHPRSQPSSSPLLVRVPLGAPLDNAARCLRPEVWHRRVVPEFGRALDICKGRRSLAPRSWSSSSSQPAEQGPTWSLKARLPHRARSGGVPRQLLRPRTKAAGSGADGAKPPASRCLQSGLGPARPRRLRRPPARRWPRYRDGECSRAC